MISYEEYDDLPEMDIDEVGGLHDGIIGYNPQGLYCGECSSSSCKSCYNKNKTK